MTDAPVWAGTRLTTPIVFAGRGLTSPAGQLVWDDVFTLNAAGAAGAFIRFESDVTAQNGINAARGGAGDSITSDASNLAGATFFDNDFRAVTIGSWGGAPNSKGSGQVYTAVGFISDQGDGGAPVWRELGLYEGTLTADSKGAYSAGMELGINLTAGKPSRANGVAMLMTENNALAAYTAAVFGAGSVYPDTGARAFAAINGGGAAVPGTAYHVAGDFVRGLLCTFTTQTNNVWEARALNAANATVQMNGLGAISWAQAGGATAPDITLSRAGVSVLGISGGLQLTTANGILYLPAGYINFTGNAFASYVTATAGTAAALPALPVGYFLIVDNTGTTRKVPYFAV
jgi:hypothetical protein